MSSLLDMALVGIALLASVLYAIVALGPRTWRRHIGAALAACGLARVAPKASGACGGCDNCAAPDAKESTAGAETRVPLEDIGRRKADH
jgi:hypothetical protein